MELMDLKPYATKELETQIKLHINEKLYEKGHITEEMYKKAKVFLLSA
jgi:hypothetical protein